MPATPTQIAVGTQYPIRKILMDQALGISANYPLDWEILPSAPDEPTRLTLHGPPLGKGPEPIIFAITVEADTATEKSVTEVVDQQMQQVPVDLSPGITRRLLNVGGEAAEQVVGLPSEGGALETFVLHGGQLFLIVLQPYDEANESLVPYLAQARSEYGDLINSWRFLK
jgi:hypothetical protein